MSSTNELVKLLEDNGLEVQLITEKEEHTQMIVLDNKAVTAAALKGQTTALIAMMETFNDQLISSIDTLRGNTDFKTEIETLLIARRFNKVAQGHLKKLFSSSKPAIGEGERRRVGEGEIGNQD